MQGPCNVRFKLTLSFQLRHTLFEAMIFNFSSGNKTDVFNKQAEPLGAASFQPDDSVTRNHLSV